MDSRSLANLRRKRLYIHRQLDRLEPAIARLTASLDETNAAIQAEAPELFLPPRRYKPNPNFDRGELPRLVREIMRDAGPLSTRAEGIPAPEGTPAPLNPEAARTGQVVRAVQEAVRHGLSDLKTDLTRIETRSHTDFNRLLLIFGAGFLAVAGLFGWGYTRLDDHIVAAASRLEDRISKLDDRVITLGTNQARTDQRLQDLIERVPPVKSPISH